MKWPKAAATSRRSMAEALATVTAVLVKPLPGRPDPLVLHRALYGWAFNPTRRGTVAPPEAEAALGWVARAARPVVDLEDGEVVRLVLDALSRTMTGKPAAATTVRRKRAVFSNALRFAVERGVLSVHPLGRVHWTAPEVGKVVDRRVVANPRQVRRLLTAVAAQGESGRRLVAFFACLYYAGMRPSEVVALRLSSCVLPDAGWGRLDLLGSEPRAGVHWTDDGRARETRELKRRAVTTVRSVPIPPELVSILQAHVRTFKISEGERLFRTRIGGPVQNNAIGEVWRSARRRALTAEQATSPLARRSYDLRHAAATLWLNSDVPATEVARRLGHSVAVLLRVYANCLDGQEVAANGSIEGALASTSEDRETLITCILVDYTGYTGCRVCGTGTEQRG